MGQQELETAGNLEVKLASKGLLALNQWKGLSGHGWALGSVNEWEAKNKEHEDKQNMILLLAGFIP